MEYAEESVPPEHLMPGKRPRGYGRGIIIRRSSSSSGSIRSFQNRTRSMLPITSWRKTRVWKFLFPIFLCAAVAIWNPPFVSFAFRTVLSVVAFPLQNVASFASYHLAEFGSFVSSIGTLKRENERLLRENMELRAQSALLSERERENESLRAEIGLSPRERFRLVAAEVIGREGGNSSGSLTVNVGEREGIRPGMAVVVGRGVLIGRVRDVGPVSSGILTLFHPESTVNAVESATEAQGIVRGEYGLGLLFDMVLQSDAVGEGDEVVTSGLGGDLPSGLLIGTVTKTESSADRLFQRATLASPARLDRARAVFIVIGESL